MGCNMEKPISIKYEDFKNQLAELINESGLPPFMIEPVLQLYLVETQNAAKKQYMKDKALYDEIQNQETSDMGE